MKRKPKHKINVGESNLSKQEFFNHIRQVTKAHNNQLLIKMGVKSSSKK